MLEILAMFAGLVAAFASQVYLVKRLVAFFKEATGLAGSWMRWLSFAVGSGLGALFLWPWIELNPGLNTSVYVLIGVLFLFVAGLTAAGDYDLSVSDPNNRAVKSYAEIVTLEEQEQEE